MTDALQGLLAERACQALDTIGDADAGADFVAGRAAMVAVLGLGPESWNASWG